MRKERVAILLAVVLVAAIAAGLLFKKGTENTGKKEAINLPVMAEEMLNIVGDAEDMTLLPAEKTESIYGISNQLVKNQIVYISSGATAHEIALFECTDEEAAGQVKQALEDRIAYQLDSFRDYVPSEVAKLEKAKVYIKDNFVCMCIAKDVNEVEAFMKRYI